MPLCKICTVQLLGSYHICVLLLLYKTFDTVIADRSSADLNSSSFGSSCFSLKYVCDEI